MRKIREILRLKWELRLSHRDAARRVGVSPATVDNVLSRAEKACLSDWAAVEPLLSEDELETRLYDRPHARVPSEPRVEPDCAWIHREWRRLGVTMELHKEYLEQHPNRLRYSAFCKRYRAFTRRPHAPLPAELIARIAWRARPREDKEGDGTAHPCGSAPC